MSDQDDRASAPERVTLAVPEMDCPSCAEKVTTSVSRLEGIDSVSTRPTSGRLVVEFDPALTDRESVEARVREAGYAVVDAEDATAGGDGGAGHQVAPSSAVWTSDEALRIWAGAVFLVAGLVVEFLLPTLNPTVATVLGEELGVADASLLAAVALAGLPVVRAGSRSARSLSLDIDLLMGAAIVAATAIGFFEEAATLAVLFSVAELLERYAMDRARDSLRRLVDLAPETATVRRDGSEATVPVEDVAVGDTVLVRPGERIPVDGTVVEGESAVDQSPITGESVPVDRTVGDEVYAGTIAEAGYLEVRATAAAGESTLAHVIELVADAEANKSQREQFVERFADVYTPVVVALALLTMAVPPLALGLDATTWFVRGLTLLVIACPCAFVISTPVSVVSAITSAARNGVLIKGGNHLESMGDVAVLATDKTGTLTKGELTVTDVVPAGGTDADDLLAVAAGLEARSEHPIADAVRERAESAGVEPVDVADFRSVTGEGVRATVDGTTHYAGKPDLFADFGLDLDDAGVRPDGGRAAAVATLAEAADALQDDGKTVVLVGTDSEVLGAIAVADEVRPGAAGAVAHLQDLGVRVVMLTGDNERTARAIAREVGIDDYRAELLPAEKVDAIEELGRAGGVAMVGDGINDAPALAAADVGVAMGAAGTDAAIETADVALLGDDLAKLPYLYALATRANSVIRENVWSSLGVKLLLALGVPLGYVGVAVAVVVGDMGMSLAVTGNALRLSRLKPDSFF